MSKPLLITTAISYPNGQPHIGHAYEAVCTDALARMHRLNRREVRFLTGTDEHGLKMVQTAAREGITPQALADQNSQHFKAMCAALNVVPDRFIRTTDADHKATCQALWQRMEAAGDIYLAKYEGWYSVRDEAYFGEDEITTGSDGTKLAPSGAPVEWTAEETYFFRLSKYRDRLLALYRDQPMFIQPDGRRNEVMRFVEGDLRDLSISRTSFTWGVPVPGDEKHVMYVWIDALTNYLTGVADADSGLDFDARVALWNNSDVVHIIGKDIVRFHAVYWPAFLMSAGLKLPEMVFGHGFLLNRGEKMSKSLGNVVDPIALVEQFGADAVRYYFLRKVSFGDDGGFSADDIAQTYNSDLANSFGNLVQRVFSFIAKNLDGRIPAPNKNLVTLCGGGIVSPVDEFPVANLMSESGMWINDVYSANQYIDREAPWTLRKSDPAAMEGILAKLLDRIRFIAVDCQPYIPEAAAKVLAMFSHSAFGPEYIFVQPGQSDGNFSVYPDIFCSYGSPYFDRWYELWQEAHFKIEPPLPIFPRIEIPKDA